jgi:YfiH family protein
MPTDARTLPAGVGVDRGGLPMITWPALQRPDLDAYVTTRDGGVSTGPYATLNLGLHVGDRTEHVLANRARVAEALGAGPDDLVFAQQVHRAAVSVVTDADRGGDAIPETDALVTAVPGIVLVVLVADCVPLVLFDPVARVVAAVHAGWRGTVQNVTGAALATMSSLGSDPADVIAGIGPAVHPDRYQVGADVAEAAGAAFGDRAAEVVRPDGTGRWTFDLWRANAIQLADAGVPGARIHLAARGTGPGTPFFSHRFEGPCGRFAAVARMRRAAAAGGAAS